MNKAVRKRASRPDWKTASRKLRTGIERELRGYPASQVASFTRSVESYIEAAKTIADIRGTDSNEPKRLRDLQRVLGVTERFVADYARIRRRVLSRPFLYKVPDMFADWSTTEPDDGLSFYPAYDQAFAAMNALLAEIDAALVTPWRRGRPAADDLGLLAQMAARWRELFDARPTSTLGGKFANVATLVLENLHGGRLPSDVSRQVRAALKSI